MQPLSSSAKDAIAAFRHRAGLSSDRKSAVRERIDASIAAGTPALFEDARSASLPPRLGARGIVVRIALPVAIAAAVLLALRAFAPEASVPRAEEQGGDGQALYEVEDATDGATARAHGDGVGRSRSAIPIPTAQTSTPGASTASVNPEEPSATEPRPSEPSVIEASDGELGATKPSSGARAVERPRAKPLAPQAPLDTTLAAEMQLLRRARSALREGDAAGALAELEGHAERFAHGQMVEDREALRVQALCDAGRAAEARAAASAFTRAHPRSPHVLRVEKICAAG